jgi:hypothetical protein
MNQINTKSDDDTENEIDRINVFLHQFGYHMNAVVWDTNQPVYRILKILSHENWFRRIAKKDSELIGVHLNIKDALRQAQILITEEYNQFLKSL